MPTIRPSRSMREVAVTRAVTRAPRRCCAGGAGLIVHPEAA